MFAYLANMNGVQGQRNVGVGESFVGARGGLDDVRLHLHGGDTSERHQGFAAVQHHHIDLPG